MPPRRRPAVATRYDKRDYIYEATADLASIQTCGYETPVP